MQFRQQTLYILESLLYNKIACVMGFILEVVIIV